MSFIRYCALILFVITQTGLFAQENIEFTNSKNSGKAKEKQIKPGIDTWKILQFGNKNDTIPVDTFLYSYNKYHPAYRNAISVSELGNYGTPALSNDFFGRERKTDFYFLGSRQDYVLKTSELQFYNTKTPYTVLDYTQSENKSIKTETRFNVLHTQNINPFLNFTFRFDIARSLGQYQNQESKNKAIAVYSNYTKNELNIYAGFIVNLLENEENGGIASDDLIHTMDKQDYINVNLINSSTKIANYNYFANGEYRLGRYYKKPNDTVEYFNPIVGFIYSFDYQRNNKLFSENEDSGNTFFKKSYFGSEYNLDSITFHRLRNVFQLKQYESQNKKFTFGKRVFLGQEYVTASMPVMKDKTIDRLQKNYLNVYLGGGIFRETGNFWKWNFEARQYLLGRNAGQTEISGIINKPLHLLGDSLCEVTIKGKLENKIADYFEEEFYSNHIQWKSDFNMEQNMKISGEISFPKYHFTGGTNYALINNYLYVDTAGVPSQTNKELLVVSVFADKDFVLGNFHVRPRILWQKASDSKYINLPDFSTFVSAYYHFVLYKVMKVQFGIDARYNTKFYASAYDPSTGLFHLQEEKKIGGFPYLDTYVNLNLKRTKFFFKLMNIGATQSYGLKGDYFTTLHYPMNRTTFRIGVNWTFYD